MTKLIAFSDNIRESVIVCPLLTVCVRTILHNLLIIHVFSVNQSYSEFILVQLEFTRCQ